LEIVSIDRPGLLSCIGQVFQDLKINIHSAKITTFGERVEDVFTISTLDNIALDQEQQQTLAEQIKQILA
jgi:[protein-PII] uridylyltransferase